MGPVRTPPLDSEAAVCRYIFQNDTPLYLRKIEKLYQIEITDARARYDHTFKDQTLDYDERWKKLYDLREEQALYATLRGVIREILEEHQSLPASNILHNGIPRYTVSHGARLNLRYLCVSRIRASMPEATEGCHRY